jgi:hypothetical protein
MSARGNVHARLKSTLGIVGIVVVLAFLALVAVRLITGRSLGLWTLASSRIRAISSLARAVVDSRSVSSYNHGDFTNVIFLHHSTGYNLIEQGGVREGLTEAGYDFWDHDYNWEGLRRPDGTRTGYSYNIPDDNTDPDGLARIFAQRAYGLPLNAFSGLLQHEVIVFKSCFPVSHITSDEQLERYKSYYLAMRDVTDQHRGRIFIVVTPPPLNPAETDAKAAARARAFANWLKSDEYLDRHLNVFTFDFFNYLAEDDPTSPDYNMLRQEYRESTDSHPNHLANEIIGPLFVDFIVDAVQRYRVVYKPTASG